MTQVMESDTCTCTYTRNTCMYDTLWWYLVSPQETDRYCCKSECVVNKHIQLYIINNDNETKPQQTHAII